MKTLEYYRSKLQWSNTYGWGFLNPEEPTETIYDKEYFEKYFTYEDTPIGLALNRARLDLTSKYTDASKVLDIGIGSGQFVRAAGCHGVDVNPHAVEYLKSLGQYAEIGPYSKWDWVTMWDVLEHIVDPTTILSSVNKGVILSMPIYTGEVHALNSKHFRPNEHIWYFTVHGLIRWMQEYGFKCVEFNRVESDIGREDIGSFVFVRV